MRWHVSKGLFLLVLIVPFALSSLGEAKEDSHTDDYLSVKKLQQALRKNNRRAVADLIAYPLQRDTPLKAIKNAKEFLAHWDEYFDSTNTQKLLNATADQIGWRGINLLNGTIWFDHGRIITINTQTKASEIAFQIAKKQDDAKLHESARGYDSISFQCRTKDQFIRAQKHGDDLRYYAWKKGATLLTKPELELHGGAYNPQGTGGNFDLVFQDMALTYTISVGHNLCGEEDCNDHLEVLEGSKTQSSEVCIEVRP